MNITSLVVFFLILLLSVQKKKFCSIDCQLVDFSVEEFFEFSLSCIGIISGALLQLEDVFSLSCLQRELVVSSMLFGALLASFCGGLYGRSTIIVVFTPYVCVFCFLDPSLSGLLRKY